MVNFHQNNRNDRKRINRELIASAKTKSRQRQQQRIRIKNTIGDLSARVRLMRSVSFGISQTRQRNESRFQTQICERVGLASMKSFGHLTFRTKQ